MAVGGPIPQQYIELTYMLGAYIYGPEGEIPIWVIEEVIDIVYEIVEALIAAFSGRPRSQATLTTAKRLMKVNNGAGRLLGHVISRTFTDANVVLSTSSKQEWDEYWKPAREQFHQNLMNLGQTAAQAEHVIDRIWQSGFGDGSTPIPEELKQPIPPADSVWGDPQIQADYQERYQKAIQAGHTDTEAKGIALRWILQHATLKQLHTIRVCPQQGECLGITPSPQPKCPPGSHWNPITEQCEPDQPPPPIPPILPGPQDELTQSLGVIEDNLKTLKQMIGSGGQQGPGPQPTDQCCQQVVAAIGQVVSALTEIATQVTAIATAPPGTAPGATVPQPLEIDWAPLLAAVPNLVNATMSYQPLMQQLIDAVSSLKPPGENPDLNRIADALGSWAENSTWTKPIFEDLIAKGVLPEQWYAQMPDAPWWWEAIKIGFTVIGELVPVFEVGSIAFALFTTPGQEAVKWFLRNVVGGSQGVIAELLTSLAPLLATLAETVTSTVDQHGNAVLTPFTAPLEKWFDSMVRSFSATLETAGESTTGNAIDTAAQAIKQAASFGIGSALVTALFETILPEKLNALNSMGPLLAGLAGFEVVSKAILEPLYRHGFGVSADYYYKGKFKPELPKESDAVMWHSRRKLTPAQLKEVFDVSGLKEKYEKPYIETAYRPLSPFILARGMTAGVITPTTLRETMEFVGLRDNDIDNMLKAFGALAIRPFVQAAITAAATAYERGDITTSDWESTLSHAPLPDEAKTWLDLEVHYRKLEQILEIFRKQVDFDYQYGEIGDADYVPTLTTAGIDISDAQARYAAAYARVHGREAVKEARAEEIQQKLLQRTAIQAAMAQFLDGIYDVPAFEAALYGAGVSLPMVGFWTAIAQARRRGRLRYVYGKWLQVSAAADLRLRVSAVAEQVVKKILSPEKALAELRGYGIDDYNSEEIVAHAAAEGPKELLPT